MTPRIHAPQTIPVPAGADGVALPGGTARQDEVTAMTVAAPLAEPVDGIEALDLGVRPRGAIDFLRGGVEIVESGVTELPCSGRMARAFALSVGLAGALAAQQAPGKKDTELWRRGWPAEVTVPHAVQGDTYQGHKYPSYEAALLAQTQDRERLRAAQVEALAREQGKPLPAASEPYETPRKGSFPWLGVWVATVACGAYLARRHDKMEQQKAKDEVLRRAKANAAEMNEKEHSHDDK